MDHNRSFQERVDKLSKLFYAADKNANSLDHVGISISSKLQGLSEKAKASDEEIKKLYTLESSIRDGSKDESGCEICETVKKNVNVLKEIGNSLSVFLKDLQNFYLICVALVKQVKPATPEDIGTDNNEDGFLKCFPIPTKEIRKMRSLADVISAFRILPRDKELEMMKLNIGSWSQRVGRDIQIRLEQPYTVALRGSREAYSTAYVFQNYLTHDLDYFKDGTKWGTDPEKLNTFDQLVLLYLRSLTSAPHIVLSETEAILKSLL